MESLRFRRVARCGVSALRCATEEPQPSWRTGCTCCSQSLNALLMPSFGLYACMYLSGHCSIYITIRPSGLCTNTKSLRSHALQGRFSGQCRLTVLGTFAFMFLLVLLLSLYSILYFKACVIQFSYAETTTLQIISQILTEGLYKVDAIGCEVFAFWHFLLKAHQGGASALKVPPTVPPTTQSPSLILNHLC